MKAVDSSIETKTRHYSGIKIFSKSKTWHYSGNKYLNIFSRNISVTTWHYSGIKIFENIQLKYFSKKWTLFWHTNIWKYSAEIFQQKLDIISAELFCFCSWFARNVLSSPQQLRYSPKRRLMNIPKTRQVNISQKRWVDRLLSSEKCEYSRQLCAKLAEQLKEINCSLSPQVLHCWHKSSQSFFSMFAFFHTDIRFTRFGNLQCWSR